MEPPEKEKKNPPDTMSLRGTTLKQLDYEFLSKCCQPPRPCNYIYFFNDGRRRGVFNINIFLGGATEETTKVTLQIDRDTIPGHLLNIYNKFFSKVCPPPWRDIYINVHKYATPTTPPTRSSREAITFHPSSNKSTTPCMCPTELQHVKLWYPIDRPSSDCGERALGDLHVVDEQRYLSKLMKLTRTLFGSGGATAEAQKSTSPDHRDTTPGHIGNIDKIIPNPQQAHHLTLATTSRGTCTYPTDPDGFLMKPLPVVCRPCSKPIATSRRKKTKTKGSPSSKATLKYEKQKQNLSEEAPDQRCNALSFTDKCYKELKKEFKKEFKGKDNVYVLEFICKTLGKVGLYKALRTCASTDELPLKTVWNDNGHGEQPHGMQKLPPKLKRARFKIDAPTGAFVLLGFLCGGFVHIHCAWRRDHDDKRRSKQRYKFTVDDSIEVTKKYESHSQKMKLRQQSKRR